MRIGEKVKYLVSVLLIVSLITSCGAATSSESVSQDIASSENISEKEEKASVTEEDKKLIEAEVNKYLSETVFRNFDKEDVLYNQYTMCASTNILASLISILDEKMGKIKANYGVNDEVAEWIFENYESKIKNVLYEKEGASSLAEIIKKDVKTKIVGINKQEKKNEYEVEITVSNIDLFKCLNSADVIKVMKESLEQSGVVGTKIIMSAVKGAAKGAVTGFGKKTRIFAGALKSVLALFKGKNAKKIKQALVENIISTGISNSYTGKVKMVVSGGTACIMEEDKKIINACYGVFDEKFLSMEASDIYEKRVTELMSLREQREKVAEKEKEEEKKEKEKRKQEEVKAKENAKKKDDENKAESVADNVETSIEQLCLEFAESKGDWYWTKEISEKMEKYFEIPKTEKIYLSHDDTILHSGKDGFVITDKGFYCNKSFENELYFVAYTEFSKVPKLTWDNGYLYADNKLISCVAVDDQGKKDVEKLYTEIFKLVIK